MKVFVVCPHCGKEIPVKASAPAQKRSDNGSLGLTYLERLYLSHLAEGKGQNKYVFQKTRQKLIMRGLVAEQSANIPGNDYPSLSWEITPLGRLAMAATGKKS